MLSRVMKLATEVRSWRQDSASDRMLATLASLPSITSPRQLSLTSRKRVLDSR